MRWPTGFVLVLALSGGVAWGDTGLPGELPPDDTGTAPVDQDGDGVPVGVDPDDASCDADGDGLPDPVELGLTAPAGGVAGGACFVADADPSTTSDPVRRDTDGGGLDDGQEDLDRNGRIDLWETDPAALADDGDRDGDGWPDVVEGDGDPDGDQLPAWSDTDSDGDGVSDRRERRLAGDDGVLALLDPDLDGDGLPDGLDGEADPDGDGVPALLDVDSDGDGIRDADEGAADLDGDDAGCHVDVNCDGDRWLDATEGTDDQDCDGVVNFLDADDLDGLCDPPAPGTVDGAPFGQPFVDPMPPSASGCDAGRAAPAGAWVTVLAVWAAGRRRRGSR